MLAGHSERGTESKMKRISSQKEVENESLLGHVRCWEKTAECNPGRGSDQRSKSSRTSNKIKKKKSYPCDSVLLQ